MPAEFDTREVEVLAQDLVRAAARVAPEARAVVQRGALNIKRQLQSEAQASGIRVASQMAAAISYDTRVMADGIEAEIGPREGAAGSLAFYYYGNSRTGPSLPDPKQALDAETPNVEKYLGRIMDGLL